MCESDEENMRNCFLLPIVLLFLVGGGCALQVRGLILLDIANERNDTSDLCRLLPDSESCTFDPSKKDYAWNMTKSAGTSDNQFYYTTVFFS